MNKRTLEAMRPGATDADGVCIGEHVGDTIVAEMAGKLGEARAEIARLTNEALPDKQASIDYWGRRTEVAEREIARLREELRPLLEVDPVGPFAHSELMQAFYRARAALDGREG